MEDPPIFLNSINITILECKCCSYLRKFPAKLRINITILECKFACINVK